MVAIVHGCLPEDLFDCVLSRALERAGIRDDSFTLGRFGLGKVLELRDRTTEILLRSAPFLDSGSRDGWPTQGGMFRIWERGSGDAPELMRHPEVHVPDKLEHRMRERRGPLASDLGRNVDTAE
jgi:hypothetical protein